MSRRLAALSRRAPWLPLFTAAAVSLSLPYACSSDDKPGGNTSDGGTDAPGGQGGSSGGSGPGSGGAGGGALTTYNVCPPETSRGGIGIQVADTFTGVEGRIFDVASSVRLGVQVGNPYGDCRLMKRPEPVRPCSPACNTELQDCAATGCVPKPQPVSVGEVKLTGLLQPMTLRYGVGTYINPPVEPPIHPLFAPGATIQLSAAGMGAYPAFTLKGFGIQGLTVPTGKLRVERGMPVTVTWTPATNPGPAKVAIDFSVNRHAATDTWFECLVDDTGSYTIAASLTDELFKLGTSGFPSVALKRVSSDTTTVNGGCVHFQVFSEASRELDVPGINSCKDDTECTAPNVCLQTLTCGAPGQP